ncbi:MAG: flavin reductase family protein [Elusimicrobia bacterium]|nr:flavin reductase family protein [Elusimicrobiota bacterium]
MNTLALTKIPYGMFIITSAFDGKIGGQIANTVFQINSNPATIAISISKQNNTHFLLSNSKKAVISTITEEASFEFIGKFGFRSSRDFNKFENVEYKTNENGLPVVTQFSNSYFETEIISQFDTLTHTVFLCKVINCEVLNENPTMTYDYYHKVKKGLTPKNAPTFIQK